MAADSKDEAEAWLRDYEKENPVGDEDADEDDITRNQYYDIVKVPIRLRSKTVLELLNEFEKEETK